MDANQRNKQRVLNYWRAIDASPVEALAEVTAKHLSEGFCCKAPAPLGVLLGTEALSQQLLGPLKKAIPTLERQIHLFLGGQSIDHVSEGKKDAFWVCGAGYFCGIAVARFLGIPATCCSLRIRWSEFIRFEGEKMVESQLLLDFVDWFDQIDLPVLPRSRGVAHVFPAATAFDGVLLEPQMKEESTRTLELGQALIYGGLNGFDKDDLSSMGMATYFHPNLKWYGPGGIGTCLSFKEFEQLHQQPWLVAFPDRKVQGLESLFAEGRLLAGSGAAGVRATHSGPYLGEPASGVTLDVSGIDFWLRTGNQFTENWVFVDMIDLFGQMGVDLFARMAAQRDSNELLNGG